MRMPQLDTLSGNDGAVNASRRKAFLIIGQSNASGVDSAANLSAGNASYASAYSACQLFCQRSVAANDPIPWEYYPPIGTYNTSPPSAWTSTAPSFANTIVSDTTGPELSLSRALIALSSNWSIVKFTVDGSYIPYWLPGSTYPTQPPGGPDLWSQMLSFVAASGATIEGIYWMQGEADAKDSTHAAAYQANLTTFLAALHAQFPNAPIILGEISSQISTITCPSLSTVRAAQVAVINSAPWTTIINNDDLALRAADSLHFTADSQITIGQRVQTAFSAALVSTGFSAALTDNTGGNITANGSAYAYTLAITNLGPNSGSSVAVQVTLPSGAHYVSASGTGWTISQAGGVVTCTRASAAVGALPSITINCTSPYTAGSGSMTCTVGIVASNAPATATASKTTNLTALSYMLDATQGVALPKTSQEWANFIAANASLSNWSAPNLLYTLGDASSPLQPAIGTPTLAATGTVSYQQAITGYATKGVKVDGVAAGNYFSSTDASLPDLSATSVLILGLIDLQNSALAPGAFPMLFGMVASGGFAAKLNANSGDWYTQNNGNTAISTNTANARGVVPFAIVHNVTALSSIGYSDKDKLIPTYSAMAATKLLMLGNNTAYTMGGGMAAVYLAVWSGTAAERSSTDVKSLLTAMSQFALAPWAPPWT